MDIELDKRKGGREEVARAKTESRSGGSWILEILKEELIAWSFLKYTILCKNDKINCEYDYFLGWGHKKAFYIIVTMITGQCCDGCTSNADSGRPWVNYSLRSLINHNWCPGYSNWGRTRVKLLIHNASVSSNLGRGGKILTMVFTSREPHFTEI